LKKQKKQIEVERKNLEKEANKKIIELSNMILEKGLADFLDEKAQKEINKNILKNLKNIN